ncbi:MAG: replicative helicase loader/inhibitor [Bacillota bacterium]
MTRQNLIKVLTFLSNSYHGKFKFPKKNKKENELLVESWYTYLQEYDYNLVKTSVKKAVVYHAEWPPTIGELIKEIQELKNSNKKTISPEKAWKIAKEAVRKYGFYDAKRAKKSTPPLVWKAINLIGGYSYLCHSKEHDTYLRSQFIKTYSSLIEEEKPERLLPSAVKEEIESFNNKIKKDLIEKRKKLVDEKSYKNDERGI